MRSPGGTAKRLVTTALGVAAALQVVGGGWAVANLPEPEAPPPGPMAPVGVDHPSLSPPPPSPPPADLPRPPAPRPPAPAEPLPAVAAGEPPAPAAVTATPAARAPVDVRPLGDLLRGLLPVVGAPDLRL